MSLGIPESPAFVVDRITDKYTLNGVRLERFALIFLQVYVCETTEGSEVTDRTFLAIEEIER